MSYFPLFTVSPEVPRRLPQWMWRPLRWCGVALAVGLIYAGFAAPEVALKVVWGLIVPAAPLVFLLIPGVWRNLCPLASMNQLPRTLGITRGLTLPKRVQRVAPLISLGLFLSVVPLRKVWLDSDGAALAILLSSALILPFIGGMVFKGKSGWCSTFCPMLSVERFYNLAPVALVPNSHCRPCLGCTKNCYDFNPTAAHLTDLYDENPRWVGYRTLLAGLLPWLIVGFNTTPSVHSNITVAAVAGVYGRLALFVIAGAGTFQLLTVLGGLSNFKAVLLHVSAAITLFYYYATPTILGVFDIHSTVAQFEIENAIAIVTLSWLWRAWPREKAFAASPLSPAGRAAPGVVAAASSASGNGVEVRFSNGPTVVASPGDSLLSVAESNGVAIEPGCRVGMCGADPVYIAEGRENLTPVAAAEQSTLDRLAAGPGCRMACVAKVNGPVRVSLDLSEAAAAGEAHDEDPGFTIDPAVRRVVVIGTGAAGITAVNEVRKLNPDCELTIVGDEPYDFYNRMSIDKLISESTSIDKLYMLQHGWAQDRNIRELLGTRVTEIRRDDHVVVTAGGEELPYDRLILASGGTATVPSIEGFGIPGTFVLRTIDNAVAIQQYLRRHNCRTALVIGGGLLGLEAAHSISHLGVRVFVLDRNPWPLHRQLDETAGNLLWQLLTDLGIDVLPGVQAVQLLAGEDGRLSRVELSDGRTLDVQAALGAAGVTAEVSLAKQASLTVKKGVVVDDGMLTSDPAIYAVGDVSEHQGRLGGLWPAAVDHARVAAANALGGAREYAGLVASCKLKVAEIDLLSTGELYAKGDDAIEICIEDKASRGYRKLVIIGGEVRGGMLVGYPELADPVADAVTHRRPVAGHLDELRAGDWSCLSGD